MRTGGRAQRVIRRKALQGRAQSRSVLKVVVRHDTTGGPAGPARGSGMGLLGAARPLAQRRPAMRAVRREQRSSES
jgi:hypothetical protein